MRATAASSATLPSASMNISAEAADTRCSLRRTSQVIQDKRKPALGKHFGGASADSLGGAGDEGDFHGRNGWPGLS